MIKSISQANFDEEIKEGTVVVDFWATWCEPCKVLGAVLEEVSKELGDKVNFAKIDADENSIIANQYKITSIPTVLVFKNGEVVDEILGFKPKAVILDLLNKHL
jgi:thioredoxin 1